MSERFFNRYEFKYLISEETAANFLQLITPHMKRDQHTDDNATYRISSLYFDTQENLFLDEYLRGECFRQKLRLRVYNTPNLWDTCFFEIKKKFSKYVNKRRAKITIGEAYAWTRGERTLEEMIETFPAEAQILREIHFLMQLYQLEPRVVISYDRQAYMGIFDENLRVTFDRYLTKRHTLLEPHQQGEDQSYLSTEKVVLEVKTNKAIPLWLASTISELECRKQTFSKYSNSYYAPTIKEKQMENQLRVRKSVKS
ncbi:VTC domain-containing protein [Tindallia magadiensis]|uniref:VTC domain-containing protein n=1 Tax=Tindallia magadiensis TaxID=69895 RepID=A0A1I3D0Z6_9FIRM|nr:polyphosphate polymerase domain-containing protein [Tindallia magadiensis]SFH80444.1 VTC domain-containing protein [Tindallia magadiensis]